MKKKVKVFQPSSLKNAKSGEEVKDIPFYSLFKYATCVDLIFIFLGVLMSTLSGALTPIMFIRLGDITGVLIDFHMLINSDQAKDPVILAAAEEKLMSNLLYFMVFNIVLAILIISIGYISVLLITAAATSQISKIRQLYMASILNKDISWYDTNQTGDFSSRIIEDIGKVEEAIGDKISTFVFYMGIFCAGIIIGLVKGWELALIAMIYLPVSVISMSVVSWISGKLVKQEMEAYANAASIAEEVLGAIRTVVAFDGQHKEIARYHSSLNVAKTNNIKKGLSSAINNGFMWLFVFCSYSLSFYYGIHLIIKERDLPEEERVYTPANMLAIFLNILVATWNFGHCLPFIQVFATGKAAAAKVFALIEEQPKINLAKNRGYKAKSFQGNVRFSNVQFHYPSRPDVKILQGLSLDIRNGETVALVGNSGCGKSTCVQLIQRFYDPVQGDVLIDGIELKQYDLKWLRSKIGVVGQEPVLFAATIAENIRYGNLNATMDQIEIAAKKANAHTFIEKLPNGYDTMVGERGSQLSGGQKQRIAIARALIRNPVILLLDEATSALDTHSEALVQEALDNASKECTTIIVAHRLSTIRGADRIVVISEGKVIEDGNHETLMKKKGAYYKLVTLQIAEKNVEDEEPEEIEEPLDIVLQRQFSVISENMPEVEESKTTKKTPTLSIVCQMLRLNKPEWFIIIIACIGAMAQGASIPAYAVIYSNVLGILSSIDNDYIIQEGNKYSLYFFLLGIACGAGAFLQTYLFTVSGEKLTLRVRTKMFESIMKQELGWFDEPEHGVGALCTGLSADASGLQGAAGQSIGTILNALSSLGIAVIIAFCFEWRLTLMTLCFIPLIFLAIYLEGSIVNGVEGGSKNSIESSANYAIEAISNIRTVASLGLEKIFYNKYLELLGPHYRKTKKSAHLRGLVLGTSRSLMCFTYGFVMYYGGTLIRDEHMDYQIIYRVFQGMISGAWAMGNAVAFTPNFQKGIQSAEKLLKLLNRKPLIIDGSNTLPLPSSEANVKYEGVTFSYPTRPHLKVLRGLDLNIMQGKTVALVGPSGCGKSTIIQLLERFYEPLTGSVTIAKRDIKYMTLSNLRSHLGIVSQEPNLFDRTIKENIAYGDNSREVTEAEIIKAAKNANIHNFITNLPLGYETRLGDKGTQLSGGQKQRVAIARALVRDPQILLLDEATSALDTESEKIVQEALDKAKSGRTCITIAHRLITIQDADVICVVNKGVVTEIGTHSELLEKRGIYYKLYNMQMGRK